MLIVSQDKVANINCNNIEAIYLLKKDDVVEINVRGNYDYTIGRYETEERAKEVLQEITIAYKEGKFLCKIADNEWQRCNTVYEMPEK